MTLLKKTRQIAELLFACLALIVIPWLPRCCAVKLANWLGRLAFRASRKLRKIALANVDTAFGSALSQSEKEGIVLQSFRTGARVIVDLFWFSAFRRKRIGEAVVFDRSFDAYFKTAPLIVVSGHIGNWEIMGQAVALHGEPCVSVVAPLDNPYITAMLNRLRQGTGQGIVMKDGALRALLKTLHEGARIAIVMDQNTLPDEGGVFVDFFGLPAPMSRAAEALAERTGAAVVLTYCMAEDDGSYRAYALSLGTAGHVTTREIAVAMEDVIRRNPGQWLWMYKRWKHVPAGADADVFPFYARKMAKT